MGMQVAGKRALVTGAGKGIGREIAARLATCGADVVAGSRTEEDVRALREEIGRAASVADLADAAARAAEQADGVDLLVNNAGISFPQPFRK